MSAEDTTPGAAPASTPTPKRDAKRTATGARKASAKSDRSRAREFALQALYQHLVGRNEPESIDHFTRDLAGFHKADSV
ncbi:MAG: N utilization substance protein B, partial [Lysobacteraceae bacterium]